MSAEPRIWALLGHRKGDNNQVLALAQGLKLPFEMRLLRYNQLRRLPKQILGGSLLSVKPESRGLIAPPWPDLVIGVGHRSVPVARYIRDQSLGRAKLVQIGNPRLHPRNFDLVISPPQYNIPVSDRVLRLPLAMGNPQLVCAASPEERDWLARFPRPHRLMVVGGPTKPWLMPPEDIADAVTVLVKRCARDGGTLIVIGSQRTGVAVIDAVAAALAGTRHALVRGTMPRYAVLLGDADEIHVTADSVSMLSEAVISGKPVGMIPIRLSPSGELKFRLSDSGGARAPLRDLRNVWRTLLAQKLVGTIERPIAGRARDPVDQAVEAVLPLLAQARR